MNTLQQYKCPCCDGSIEFSGSAQKMMCPYCDTEFEMDTLREYDEALNREQSDNMAWKTDPGLQWLEGEDGSLRIYQCKTCGGEIVTDETTAATSCPYCSNPVVMMGQLAGDLKPDLVIPFRYEKKDAMEALKKHYRGKRLLPKIFSRENHIQEVKGVYVPVWLFDADAQASIRYKATRVRSWSDSNYHYTETKHYSVFRSGSMSFANVPVDGSSKMDDTLMESIEPYDLSGGVDFQTAYLAGFFADRYDVNAQQSVDRANERIRNSTEQAFAGTVLGYSTVVPVSTRVNLNNGEARYALYPVWLLNTSWKGKDYHFAMNGQTGKFAGDLPMDKGAFFRWLFGVAGAVSAAVFAGSYLLWLL